MFRSVRSQIAVGRRQQLESEIIRELARLVDRNPPEVLDNVNELAGYGPIQLE